MLNFSVLNLNILLLFVGFEANEAKIKVVKFRDLFSTDYINPQTKQKVWTTILVGKQANYLAEYNNYVNKSKTIFMFNTNVLKVDNEDNIEVKMKYNIVYNNKRYLESKSYTIGSTQKAITNKFDFDGTKMAFTYTVESIY